jgi:D-alanyl-D-alanine carboxypeptidase (penicillin-binding protein 5/6)
MKLIAVTLVLLLAAVMPPVLHGSAAYQPPASMVLSARSAMLVALGSNEEEDSIMFEREADLRRSPGALLRVMAGAYAVSEIRARGMDMASAGTYTNYCDGLIRGSGLATANMKVGDTWTLRDLLTVAMIDSAADTAVTMATAISGSVEGFVAGMNTLAVEIGCENTQFANVTGLDAAEQYTTARDIVRITRYAMQFQELTAILELRQHAVAPVTGAAQTRVNVNAMLRSNTDSYYKQLVFGRTGYTDGAGRCMVSVARDKGYEYMTVVLGCAGDDGKDLPTAHYRDARALYNWAFGSFEYKTIFKRNQPVTSLPVELAWGFDSVQLIAKQDVSVVADKALHASSVSIKPVLDVPSVDAPVEKGTVYGKAILYINIDQKIGEVELVAAESIQRSEILAFWRTARRVTSSWKFYAAVGAVVLLLIAYVVLNVVHNRRRKNKTVNKTTRFK